MRQAALAVAVLLIPALLRAQNAEAPFRYKGYGYTYFSMGSCQHRYLNLGVGGGGEGFVWRGLTLGGDLGYFDFPSDRSRGYGVTTLNVGYHFVDRNTPKKLDPYVSVGVLGLAAGPEYRMGAGSLGGGVNYWFRQRIGLYTGAQIQVAGEEAMVQFRIGLTFR